MTFQARILWVVWVLSIGSMAGCIELQLFLNGQAGRDETDASSGDNVNSNVGGGEGPLLPVVQLSVSNPAPTANETVVFTCRVVNGDSQGLTFAFESSTLKLMVDEQLGVASLIIDETDVGRQITTSCTAIGDEGSSEPSTAVVIPTETVILVP